MRRMEDRRSRLNRIDQKIREQRVKNIKRGEDRNGEERSKRSGAESMKRIICLTQYPYKNGDVRGYRH